MNQHLTIAYITARKDPKIEWFLDSLHRELQGNYDGIEIILVDFYFEEEGRAEFIASRSISERCKIHHVAVKPNVWQGKYRLTKEDWWAAANSRNTALCYAKDGWIAYVDDLSVLLPGWMNSVNEAIAGNYVVFGAYKKVKDLVVENGVVQSFTPHPQGVDGRLKAVTQDLTPCHGGWMFGYSCGPVEHYLRAGGWPEYSDGLKFEDCLMGVAFENNGFQLKYDRRMMVYESEELHYSEGKTFISRDKGVSPNDKSHAALEIAKKTKRFDNFFGGTEKIRTDVLNGIAFPTDQVPSTDWYDGQPLSEL